MVGLSRKRVFPKTKGDSITGQDRAQKHCDLRFSQIKKKSKVAVLQLEMMMMTPGLHRAYRTRQINDMVFEDISPTESVIWLPAHPASFAHNFVSGMLLLICLWHYDVAHRLYVLSNLWCFSQCTLYSEMQTFYFSESQDSTVLQTCH